MEAVLLLVVMIGIALVAVPRLQRRRAARRRPARVKRAAAPAVASAAWTSEEDGWDDDLGWEGTAEQAPPETREPWERWRGQESPRAAAPEPAGAVAEPGELPSVERWRATAPAASGSGSDEWLDDDDGLGWEGGRDSAPAVAGAAPVTANGNGHAVAAVPLARTAQLDPEGDDWAPGRQWGARDGAPAVAAPRRQRRLHPVALVAIYAAAGIGLVVLASTALLGGSSDPAPAVVRPAAPAPKAVVAPAAAVPAAAVEDTSAAEAATAAALKARSVFALEQARAERLHQRALDRARAAERKERARARAAAAKRKRERERREREREAASPPTTTAPPASGGTSGAPAPSYTAPARPRGCEFCIG